MHKIQQAGDPFFSFQVDDQWLAIDLIRVRSVAPAARMEQTGDAPFSPALAGFINTGSGEKVPVLDFKALMGRAQAQERNQGEIIVVSLGAGNAGFLVDRAGGTIRIEPIAGNRGARPPDNPVLGTAQSSEKTYLLLDIAAFAGWLKTAQNAGENKESSRGATCREENILEVSNV
jgi:chemotaxis signal transduction protein